MIELRQYQEKAIERLRTDVTELLDEQQNSICIFKAPTGSGKTLMVAELLARLAQQHHALAFVWISINQLHHQSKEKLEKYYATTRALRCSSFDDLEGKKILENEILFFNWQSINKGINLYIKENEHDNNLDNVIQNTLDDGRTIILIIDESHHSARTESSQDIIGRINPKITIEVSATPKGTAPDRIVNVPLHDVKAEGMIKNEIAINPSIDEKKTKPQSADRFILECALKQRAILAKAYKEQHSDVNPLVLIQLPDKREGFDDKKETLISTLKAFGITEENRKLAIYMTGKENKVNLENIEKPDNETEVLLFKQAIALGWDCPRSSILVLFREWHSNIFSIQTLGRIMRMPGLMHYDDERLNKGYVFTNLSDIEIAEDIAKDYITQFEAKRKDTYKPIDLPATYIKRQRERTRLTGHFTKIFAAVAKKQDLHKKITRTPSALETTLIVDGKITEIDRPQIVAHEGELAIALTEEELNARFRLYARSVCAPFAPADSIGRISTALYTFFEQAMKIDDWTRAQIIVLGKENKPFFDACIQLAKERYTKEVVERLLEQGEKVSMVWNVPRTISYSSIEKEHTYAHAIMHPYFGRDESSQEAQFIKMLEESKKDVAWWFKNGTKEQTYFSLIYTDNKGKERSFFPDFIFQYADGTIGIFDTKEGFTAEDATEKAEALAKYLDGLNKKHKKSIGGILTVKENVARYHPGKGYQYNKENLGTGWRSLILR